MKEALIAGCLTFAAGVMFQYALTVLQRRLHVSQVQKSYGIGIDVEIKGSTPTMGGVVFLLLAVAVLSVQRDLTALLFWSLPIASGIVGFVDDWLKVVHKSSEGFRSLRKLAAQTVIAFIWVCWMWKRNGIYLWPGLEVSFWFSFPFAMLATVGMMNAVNVTDGLDGLAGGAFMISLCVLGYLMPGTDFGFTVFAVLFALTASFLLFNVRPALIFMGDTGSHFLGGALVALCLQYGMLLAVIPAGFLFGIELFSSAVQILGIRGFDRKIFKMAPLHHHFQRMGWDETTVTSRFLIIHAVGAAFLAALCVKILGI